VVVDFYIICRAHHLLSVSHITRNATLAKLPCVDGASWDPNRVCLSGTRKVHLADIWTWASTPSPTDSEKTAEICWLTGVAGAGKTAIAHTIAHRCFENQLLVSSFFFDRDTPGRNDPHALISKIAYDLSRVNSHFAEKIANAIQLNRSLTSAPISRQFEELILKPSQRCTVDKPMVIVIDALDEGCNPSLLTILYDKVPCLPPSFRILITSRADKDFVLLQKDHIRSMAMNIDEQANLHDIALYIRYRLKLIANQRQLGDHWPGQMLCAEFVNQAEGLFLWASTMCDYLLCAGDPTTQLEMLLSKQRPPAEQKMDTVYAHILGSCCWQDNDFAKSYGLIMGAILAAKTPLSLSALQAFHPSIPHPVSGVIDSLGPLLTVPTDDERPVGIHHQLLREYLTVQAKLLPETEPFYINEVEHSQRLVLLCLGVLNQGMMQNIPGTGYLCGHTDHQHGIPKIAGDHITEGLWYACRFWMDHLVEVDTPMESLKDLLQVFFSENVVCWMEIMASKGQNCALHRVHKWIIVSMYNRDILQCSDISILI
jgi:hypothetical protein